MYSLILVAVIPLVGQLPPPSSARDPGKPPAVKDATNADMVLRWNAVTLDLIRKERTPPPVAARNLAMVHAAIYDAVNATAGKYRHYLVDIRALPGTSAEAATAAAAHRVLAALYTKQRRTLDEAFAEDLARVPQGEGERAGLHLGRFAAEQVLGWRAGDGLDQKATYAPAAAPGIWQPTPPDFAEALLPQWPRLAPFTTYFTLHFQPRSPPRLADAEYTRAFQEVKLLGAANSKTRTTDQTQIAHFWADGAGTCTPPGHWNQIAAELALQRGSTLVENARLFALLNITLADAAILCWDCKYRLGFWRPVTAIRNASPDDNADLVADPEWTPLLNTPPFPSYVSGHSTFSGAAATVVAEVFGDKSRFRTRSDGLPGVTRSFNSLWAAAEEAGMSRIYGGIHWQFDNTEGLALGQKLGRFVTSSYLSVRPSDRAALYGR